MKLNEFTASGKIPKVENLNILELSEDSKNALVQLQNTKVEHLFNSSRKNEQTSEVINAIIEIFSDLSEKELNRQRVILELITTEASYIRHIRTAVDVSFAKAPPFRFRSNSRRLPNVFFCVSVILFDGLRPQEGRHNDGSGQR